MKFKSFETERLLIQPTTELDAAFILGLFNMPKWIQFIGDRNIRTVDDAKDYIRDRMIPQFERLGFGNYTMIEKDGNQKIGTVGLYDREGLDGIDIGFALLPEYEQQGFAFEASKCLLDAAFNEFGLTVVRAITTSDNLASQKLLDRLGLKPTGTTKLSADDEELLVYAINKP